MNKLKSIKIQKPDGTFTSKIPIGADAKDVDLTDGRTVQQAITSLDQEIDENYEDLIQISNTQPVSEANKIWIKSNDTQIEIPTMDDLTAVEAKIGSPLVAATAAAMADTTKVYVYTGSETGYTNGNWYYYNGSAWASGGVYNAVAVSTDTTLTQQGQAADAKKTGDEISDLKSAIEEIEPGLSDEAKEALLACFAHVMWRDTDGQDYYDVLYNALYEYTPIFDYGIYEPDVIVNGKYIDGNGDIQTGTPNASFYIEDYIPVVRSNYWIGMNPSSLRVQTPSSTPLNESNWRISEYDESKNFIKQTQFYSGYNICASTLQAFDSNTKYMRLGWYDTNSSTNSKEFDIENPANITELPVEVGNIDVSTGANSVSTTRVRTAGYIPVSNTITISGCPFYDSWSDWISLWTSAGYSVDSFFYVVRCYDSNKNFLGTLTYNDEGIIKQNISNVSLPVGTAYVRMLFQTENHAAFSITLINHLITINGTKYCMKEAS